MSREADKVTGDGKQTDSADDDGKWARAKEDFEILKNKIAASPVLQQFDPDRTLVVVVYASDWAVSAAMMQEHDGVYMPVNFTSRTLTSNELNYGTVETEVLALLRILDVCYTTLVPRSVKVMTRHST
ncbi:hypothetical protein PC129_g7075 [Phytophthora cactorum]|nr:hypothetical protein Pcac1_g10260 [Phytophthora cactorum]KAG2829172.1 hypothetical protein PC111_g7883 [Phytophthora cactorum]KAG2838343.1 hypothetical protein PC112_g4546 [Phytophthora cactorum]KAG2861405.1 hypothetical protein PC113_g7200 [Phytophthora cactorum]KAG2915979.1 hypothetical protein PC114_g7643 [Phytophthora cactorum]